MAKITYSISRLPAILDKTENYQEYKPIGFGNIQTHLLVEPLISESKTLVAEGKSASLVHGPDISVHVFDDLCQYWRHCSDGSFRYLDVKITEPH